MGEVLSEVRLIGRSEDLVVKENECVKKHDGLVGLELGLFDLTDAWIDVGVKCLFCCFGEVPLEVMMS